MTRILTGACSLLLIAPTIMAQPVTAVGGTQSLAPENAAVASIAPHNGAISGANQDEGDDIDRLFNLYRTARSTGMKEEADTLAKRIVNVSIESYGLDSKTTAIALTNLAIVQTSNDDNASAILNYSSAINIVERVDNRLSPDLIVPLKGLGTAQMQAGNADHARDALLRALHISHVNFGPHNYDQIETLYSIARLFARAGMSDEANKIRKRIYYLHSRNTDSRGKASLPSI